MEQVSLDENNRLNYLTFVSDVVRCQKSCAAAWTTRHRQNVVVQSACTEIGDSNERALFVLTAPRNQRTFIVQQGAAHQIPLNFTQACSPLDIFHAVVFREWQVSHEIVRTHLSVSKRRRLDR